MASKGAPQNDTQIAVNPNKNKKRWYLLMSNPSKKTHLGTLLRCAAAFQVHQVLLVGYDKFNCQGSFGSHLYLDIVVFPTWESVYDYLRRGGDDSAADDDSKCNTANNGEDNDVPAVKRSKPNNEPSARIPIQIIGIQGAYAGGEEIFSTEGVPVYKDSESEYTSLVPPQSSNGDGQQQDTQQCLPHRSYPITTRPFSSDTCFILSKDRKGLPLSQAQLCSGFVHLPHLSFDDDDAPSITQSTLIDTATTVSTILHHFTAWARYEERSFDENQKFVKEMKSNNRRRLCRVYEGPSKEKKEKNDSTESKKEEGVEGNTEQDEAMCATVALFGGDTSKGGDY